MVKSVVKPLIMRILRESRVPKKSVFTRVFGVFCFGMPWGRCPAPKPSALPTALHPDYSVILAPKPPCLQGFAHTDAPHLDFIWNGYIIADFFWKVKPFAKFFMRMGGEAVCLSPFFLFLFIFFLLRLSPLWYPLHQECAEPQPSNRRVYPFRHTDGKFDKRSPRAIVW